MGMPYEAEEIDSGMIWEGIEELPPIERDIQMALIYDRARADKVAAHGHGLGYWLDNCGDDEWYCRHCLQKDCEKRKQYYGW